MSEPPSRTQKEARIRELFLSVAPRYDFLNGVLSLGRHAAWRRLAAREMRLDKGGAALDVCCGTGDLALEMARAAGQSGSVVGADFCEAMLERAALKARRNGCECLSFVAAAADHLPFPDGAFDGVGAAFGLRNVADVGDAIGEMARVVRPGGSLVSLEIFGVRSGLSGFLWTLYFHVIAPRIVGLLGGNRAAYGYLSASVASFMAPEELSEVFRQRGLCDVRVHRLALGGVCVHVGTKVG